MMLEIQVLQKKLKHCKGHVQIGFRRKLFYLISDIYVGLFVNCDHL